MTSVPTAKWNFRNCSLSPSGDIVVAQGLVDDSRSDLGGVTILASQSVKNPRTGDMIHYFLAGDSQRTYIYVINGTAWVTEYQIQVDEISDLTIRPGFCVTVVGMEVLVTSPMFETYHGVLGSYLALAQKVDSINALNTAALDPPSGISVSWAGRAVVADEQALWFSDALAPRTFVAQNALTFPGGKIYGLHVSAGGALIICSESGVFSLSEQAAAAGQIVIGVFEKLSDRPTFNYDTTCVSKGRVYGLTQRGYALFDMENSVDVLLDEEIQDETGTPRLAFADYTEGRIFGHPDGPIVTISGHSHFTNQKFMSWRPSLSLRGLLVDESGEIEFVKPDKIVYESGEVGASAGAMKGRLPSGPGVSPVLRSVSLVTDEISSIIMYVGNSWKLVTPTHSGGTIVGTTTWGSSTYAEAQRQNHRFLWSRRSNELTIIVRCDTPYAVMPEAVDAIFKGPGRYRP